MATVLNPAVGTGAYIETLADLRVRILRRLGFGAQVNNPPPGMTDLINEFLQSAQTVLAKRYPELVTERYFTWTLTIGERFYVVSDDDDANIYKLDPRRVKGVFLEDLNGSFYPLAQGIPAEVFTENDFGLPYRYEIRQAISIWPAPDQAYKLHIKGHYLNLPFAADVDTVSIDPEVIFLLALANAKAHYQQPDAQSYYSQAVTYLGDITAGTHGTARYVPAPGGMPPPLTKPVFTGTP